MPWRNFWHARCIIYGGSSITKPPNHRMIMKNRMHWLMVGLLFLAPVAACSSPTNPPFPGPNEDEDPDGHDDGDEQAFFDVRLSADAIVV